MKAKLMQRLVWLMLSLMYIGTAVAGPDDCSVSGGGNFESDEGVVGPTHTGGHIVAKYGSYFDNCNSSDVSGVWMINLADGTRFQALDIKGSTFFPFGSFKYFFALGTGEYEGETVSFEFLFEDAQSSFDRDRITFELYDEYNAVVTRAAGYVERGSIKVDLAD